MTFYLSLHITIGNKTKTGSQQIVRPSTLAAYNNIHMGNVYYTRRNTKKATKCAVQTNQQVKGRQNLSSQTILDMLNQLSLYSYMTAAIVWVHLYLHLRNCFRKPRKEVLDKR